MFSGRFEKQDGRPGLWLAETFFWLLIWNRWQNSTKLDRKQDLNIFYQVWVFLALSEKTRWMPCPLIGQDIFNFSSETTERNSTKLDRKQDLNVLYLVCVFRADQKKQGGGPSLWLADTFSTSFVKPLNGIQRNLTGSKILMSSTKCVFSGSIWETRWPPWPLIGWGIGLKIKRDIRKWYHTLAKTGHWRGVLVFHGWFHLHWLSRAARNWNQARITKWKMFAHSGIRSHDPRIRKQTP